MSDETNMRPKVKRDCETCQMIVPALVDLAAQRSDVVVITQDDPSFPTSPIPTFDEDLALSWHANGS